MAALSSMYSSVRLFAQQCPDATIKKFLIEAIRDFCRRSWYYQQTVLVNQVAGTGTYTIVPSNSEEVIAIDYVQQDGVNLDPIDQEDADYNGREATGYVFEPPNYLFITPTPTTSVTSGIELRLVLMPPENTTTLPDSIYRNYKETIAAGALSYILSMQNEAWSNPALAQQKYLEFMNGVYAAKGQRLRGFRAGPISVKPRAFAI